MDDRLKDFSADLEELKRSESGHEARNHSCELCSRQVSKMKLGSLHLEKLGLPQQKHKETTWAAYKMSSDVHV